MSLYKNREKDEALTYLAALTYMTIRQTLVFDFDFLYTALRPENRQRNRKFAIQGLYNLISNLHMEILKKYE